MSTKSDFATYVATVETARRKLDNDRVDAAIERLAHHHPSISQSPRGWATATLTLPAESLAQAAVAAMALARVALDADPIGCEIYTEDEFDARQGWIPSISELDQEVVSVSEAANRIGVTRQRVLQMIGEGKVQATKVGRGYVIALSSLPNRRADGALIFPEEVRPR